MVSPLSQNEIIHQDSCKLVMTQGKVKKTKRFALTKRILSSSDNRVYFIYFLSFFFFEDFFPFSTTKKNERLVI